MSGQKFLGGQSTSSGFNPKFPCSQWLLRVAGALKKSRSLALVPYLREITLNAKMLVRGDSVREQGVCERRGQDSRYELFVGTTCWL